MLDSGIAGDEAIACITGDNCFVAGTELAVPSPDGGFTTRRIEDFSEGSAILTRDENDVARPVETSHVERIFVRRARTFYLKVGGKEIRTTGEHPFFVRGKGWVKAASLSPGDLLAGHDDRWTPVDSSRDTGEIETVYNLRVARCRTYFVTSRTWGFSVWAHNTYLSSLNEGELKDIVAGEREAFGIAPEKTVVLGDYEISTLAPDGPTTAHSGETSVSGTVGVPADRVFETQVVGHDRAFDAEVKYLEDLAVRLDAAGGTPEGTVTLIVHSPANEICPSCQGVINQFERRYPGVRVIPKVL